MTPYRTKVVVEFNEENEKLNSLGISTDGKEVELKTFHFGFILEEVSNCRQSSNNEGLPENYTYISLDDRTYCIDVEFNAFYKEWAAAKKKLYEIHVG